MIPGSNILSMAQRIISKQEFDYYPYVSRTLNEIGNWISKYAAGTKVLGSVQPIARSLYEAYGLDFQKSYFNFFVPADIFDVGRDIAGDQFVFQCKNYQCVSKTAWYGIDGWVEVLCIEVTPY